MNTPDRQPTMLQSVFPLIMMFIILMGGRLYLNYRIEPLILFSAVIAGLVAWYLRCPWQKLEKAILNKIDVAMQGMLVIFSVGCMVGAWMFCGTVPYMVYWGLQLVNPHYMLLSAFLICTLTSCCTGTSWGSAATIGVAMMGVGLGLGLPAGVVAGAVISGAYFGNGFSPVSDAPLMQSSVLGIDIWDHIKFMAPTTGIAWLISAVLYGILGARYAGTSVDLASVNDMLASLESLFHINVVTLIPMAVVLVMMIMRYSALMSILCGSVVGIFVAVFMQGFSVAEVTGFMKSVPIEIEEAAIIQDIPWIQRMTRIIIPIQKSSIISGFLLPFMTCLRELSLFMLLCVQGFILSTTLDYFDEMGLYAFSSGINLILIITILICNTLVNKITGASLDKGIGG